MNYPSRDSQADVAIQLMPDHTRLIADGEDTVPIADGQGRYRTGWLWLRRG